MILMIDKNVFAPVLNNKNFIQLLYRGTTA
jgi:hypothetical protein